MWGWEKAIPRKMHIHMSIIGYRDEEGILYSLFFEILKTDICSYHVQSISSIID